VETFLTHRTNGPDVISFICFIVNKNYLAIVNVGLFCIVKKFPQPSSGTLSFEITLTGICEIKTDSLPL